MSDRPKQGITEAHTRADPGENPGDAASDQAGEIAAKVADAGSASRDDLGAAVEQIAAELEAAPEQFDLLAQDIEPADHLSLAGEIVASRNRARGRPKGSANKRNTQVFDYLEQLGHRDPATTLSLVQTADTLELAKMLGAPAIEVLREQVKAAARLMEFKYAKKPATLEIPTGAGKRPVMVIGDVNMTQINQVCDGARRLGVPRGQTIDNVDETE